MRQSIQMRAGLFQYQLQPLFHKGYFTIENKLRFSGLKRACVMATPYKEAGVSGAHYIDINIEILIGTAFTSILHVGGY